MPLTILHYPHEILTRRAAKVEIITPKLLQLAKCMAASMYNDRGIGLAAPQVGHSIRLILVDISGPGKREELLTLFNPEIHTSMGAVESEEGCLSVPNFRCNVDRAERITVRGQNQKGTIVTIDAEGLLAICLQHEIDHLNGLLILDHASRLKRILYIGKIKKWQRKECNA
ncbi:peptide deformylase [Desulfovibrionales bacterium]